MRRPETSHRAHRALAVLSIASATVLTLSLNARADEGGVPFWFSGQYASLAAVPATPGWSLPIQGYYYNGNASGSKSFARGDSVALGLKSRLPLLLAQPTYAPDAKQLGGQLAVGVGFGYGKNTTQADVSVSPRGTELNRSDSVWGFTDFCSVLSLAWTSGVHNWMTSPPIYRSARWNHSSPRSGGRVRSSWSSSPELLLLLEVNPGRTNG